VRLVDDRSMAGWLESEPKVWGRIVRHPITVPITVTRSPGISQYGVTDNPAGCACDYNADCLSENCVGNVCQ
jgi:hypothetical protein